MALVLHEPLFHYGQVFDIWGTQNLNPTNVPDAADAPDVDGPGFMSLRGLVQFSAAVWIISKVLR